MPPARSAIDNAGSNFCVHSAKGSEGHLLYSMDVRHKLIKMKKIYRALTVYFIFLLLSVITTACCEENYRIIGSGMIKAINLETGEIFEDSSIGTITNRFRIDWEIETMISESFFDLNFIQSAYATSCDEIHENDWDVTSFKVTSDREFIYDGNIIQPGSNLIDIKTLILGRTYFGASVTFDENFINNSKFLDEIYEFKFEMNTTDGLTLERIIKLKFELN